MIFLNVKRFIFNLFHAKVAILTTFSRNCFAGNLGWLTLQLFFLGPVRLVFPVVPCGSLWAVVCVSMSHRRREICQGSTVCQFLGGISFIVPAQSKNGSGILSSPSLHLFEMDMAPFTARCNRRCLLIAIVTPVMSSPLQNVLSRPNIYMNGSSCKGPKLAVNRRISASCMR